MKEKIKQKKAPLVLCVTHTHFSFLEKMVRETGFTPFFPSSNNSVPSGVVPIFPSLNHLFLCLQSYKSTCPPIIFDTVSTIYMLKSVNKATVILDGSLDKSGFLFMKDLDASKLEKYLSYKFLHQPLFLLSPLVLEIPNIENGMFASCLTEFLRTLPPVAYVPALCVITIGIVENSPLFEVFSRDNRLATKQNKDKFLALLSCYNELRSMYSRFKELKKKKKYPKIKKEFKSNDIQDLKLVSVLEKYFSDYRSLQENYLDSEGSIIIHSYPITSIP